MAEASQAKDLAFSELEAQRSEEAEIMVRAKARAEEILKEASARAQKFEAEAQANLEKSQ